MCDCGFKANSYKLRIRNLANSTKNWRQIFEFFFQIPKDSLIFHCLHSSCMYIAFTDCKTFRDWICLYRPFSRCKIDLAYILMLTLCSKPRLGHITYVRFWSGRPEMTDHVCNGWTLLNEKKRHLHLFYFIKGSPFFWPQHIISHILNVN